MYTFCCNNAICINKTRLTRRVSYVGQELPTLPEHLSSPSVFSEVRVDRSLVFCFSVVFCRSLLVFIVPFSFDHCIVCLLRCMASLSLRYLQSFIDYSYKAPSMKVSDTTVMWSYESVTCARSVVSLVSYTNTMDTHDLTDRMLKLKLNIVLSIVMPCMIYAIKE
jgi:hypothetical protein